jgi:hypothetical protein
MPTFNALPGAAALKGAFGFKEDVWGFFPAAVGGDASLGTGGALPFFADVVPALGDKVVRLVVVRVEVVFLIEWAEAGLLLAVVEATEDGRSAACEVCTGFALVANGLGDTVEVERMLVTDAARFGVDRDVDRGVAPVLTCAIGFRVLATDCIDVPTFVLST